MTSELKSHLLGPREIRCDPVKEKINTDPKKPTSTKKEFPPLPVGMFLREDVDDNKDLGIRTAFIKAKSPTPVDIDLGGFILATDGEMVAIKATDDPHLHFKAGTLTAAIIMAEKEYEANPKTKIFKRQRRASKDYFVECLSGFHIRVKKAEDRVFIIPPAKKTFEITDQYGDKVKTSFQPIYSLDDAQVARLKAIDQAW